MFYILFTLESMVGAGSDTETDIELDIRVESSLDSRLGLYSVNMVSSYFNSRRGRMLLSLLLSIVLTFCINY